MKLILGHDHNHFRLIHKANRVDTLVYYKLSNPFLYIQTIKNRYKQTGLVILSEEMEDKLIKEMKDIDTIRINLLMDEEPDKPLEYDKIFRYENILMLKSGLVDVLEIFPELF